jgi:hypothetical protein
LFLATSVFTQVSSQQRSVPRDFSYPEASEIVAVAVSSRSLAAVVRAPNGEVLADALVERMSADWKNRLDAAFTNSKGEFNLFSLPDGKYFLRVSKSGFSTLKVKVSLKRKEKSRLDLKLPLGI